MLLLTHMHSNTQIKHTRTHAQTQTHTHTPHRYETTNHLWLILEYCVGGDLMSLLRQDVRLPESSVHDFGRDLVVALQVRLAF